MMIYDEIVHVIGYIVQQISHNFIKNVIKMLYMCEICNNSSIIIFFYFHSIIITKIKSMQIMCFIKHLNSLAIKKIL